MVTTRAAYPAAETEPKTDASRYGTVSAQKFDEPAPGSLGAADIAPAMAALRKSFATEKTLSREWRIGQLLALRQLLVEGRDELCEAMRADLHKPRPHVCGHAPLAPARSASQSGASLFPVDGARPGRGRDPHRALQPGPVDETTVHGNLGAQLAGRVERAAGPAGRRAHHGRMELPDAAYLCPGEPPQALSPPAGVARGPVPPLVSSPPAPLRALAFSPGSGPPPRRRLPCWAHTRPPPVAHP
eukprot:scaffold27429_cov90-Isochrysis_galbana.AAC.1